MFLNYQNIANNYTPNNIIKEFDKPQSYTKLDPKQSSKPYENYNSKGDLEGYFWYYGDVLNLEFNIDGEITIESDAILFSTQGEAPNSFTPGYIGQRAYNIVDLASWTCVGVSDTYSWQKDSEFTYPEANGRKVYLSASDYLKDKKIVVRLYNFRFEQIYESTFEGNSRVVFPITKELSEKLLRGIYYCSLMCVSENTCQTIFNTSDCKLLVK